MTTPIATLAARGTASPTRRARNVPFLDSLRGLAAIYVLFVHARWLLWEGFISGYFQHSDVYPPLAKVVVYLLLGLSWGSQVVLLFFVLSGFVIHLPQALRRAESGVGAPLHWPTYYRRRAMRIYPPFLFALALTFVVDRAGMAAGLPVYFEPTILNLDFRPAHDLGTLVGNLAFTMTVYVQPFGTNGPFWSLMYEWWFYMLYPLFWWIARRSFGRATALMVGLYALSFFPTLWPLELARVVFGRMILWWLGVILAEIYAGNVRLRLSRLALLMLLAVPLAPLEIFATPSTPQLRSLADLAWAAVFVGLIAGLLAWRNRGGSLRLLEALQSLAPFSYTLYVTHFPIQLFLCGLLIRQAPDGRLPSDVRWIFIGAGICIVVAYAAHFLVERPFLSRRRGPESATLSKPTISAPSGV
ncbi:MAG: acyltransferase [Anaerolineae bacterium]|nr:acyltransferase [Anaerolineae bacterium]